MRVFHAELALALALGLLVLPAAAQQGAPIRLAPPQRLAPPSPAPPAAEPQSPPSNLSPGAPSVPSAPSGIEVAPLAPVDPEWSGILGEDNGGFPPTLWQGTPRSVVFALVSGLPLTTSPTLQDLSRRLLLANALPAAGREEASGFLAGRAEKLLSMGFVRDASALVDAGPRRSEAAERARIELKLLAGDPETACQEVREAVRRHQGVWWDRALVACHALAGRSAEAALGLNLLREQNAPKDAAFDALVETLGGRKAKLPPMPEPTPVHLALLGAAKLPYPGDLAAVKAPAALRAIALADGTPMPQRLAAAERAAAFGALAPDELRSVYDAAEFSPDERANALSRAKKEEGARARALLWSAAKAQSLPGPRAELLKAFLADARADYLLAARIVEPLLAEIAPSPELAWFGADAARALYAIGRPADARAWLAVAEPEAAKAVAPLAKLAEGSAVPLPVLPDGKAEQAPLFFGLVEALGESVPADVWAPYLRPGPAEPAPLPPAALLLAQHGAVEGKRLGEALLLLVATLAEGDRLTSEPLLLVRAVAGLRALGLEETARGLAIEAALAAGL